jgi:hypothetical protein
VPCVDLQTASNNELNTEQIAHMTRNHAQLMRFPLTITPPRRIYLIVIAAIGLSVLIAVWNQPALLRVGTLYSLLNQSAPPKLPVPVQEVASRELEDTWGAPRSDNRRHEGIDIFAPLGARC